MKTIQLALLNSEYAQSLRSLLLRDGSHQVVMVDRPDLKTDGVVVIDESKIDNLSLLEPEPERFVVITRKGTDHLSKVWEAGVRHVVFEGDSPNTAQLAIIAAELRLPAASRGGSYAPHVERRRTVSYPSLPILDATVRCRRCRFQSQSRNEL